MIIAQGMSNTAGSTDLVRCGLHQEISRLVIAMAEVGPRQALPVVAHIAMNVNRMIDHRLTAVSLAMMAVCHDVTSFLHEICLHIKVDILPIAAIDHSLLHANLTATRILTG